ncbi:hypothetical protein [Eleftheria terrae]|uniref:hypothetical protein n=1 Tax=Eleftheria terrae TaxID=1597781 RepID=UPI00263B20D9|nr:hypothetical protein [Eleftheria terrae]WKB56032.1 hypothetical protein N7L95_28620 [Eleftheria terrae]
MSDSPQRFEILFGSVVVGTSALESGDPSMGVAFGRLVPKADYAKVKNRVLTAEEGQHQERLAVRTQDGMVLKCEGVSIADHSDEVGEDGIEVAVLGISHPSYSTLFPDRE